MMTTRGVLGIALLGSVLSAGCASSGRQAGSQAPQFVGGPTAVIFVKGVT